MLVKLGMFDANIRKMKPKISTNSVLVERNRAIILISNKWLSMVHNLFK